MNLSHEQIRFFRDMGYLRLPTKMPLELVTEMREVIIKQADAKTPPLRTDSNGQVIRLDQIFTRDSIFTRVLSSSIILDPLESLLGPNIELVLNRHNHATFNARESTIFRLHRDILQWSRTLVTVILYLDNATVETGCTHIIPGSHYLPFVGIPNNGGTWMDEHNVYNDLLKQALPVPMDSGGVLVFDSLVFHSVGENHSDQTRMSVCMGYHSVDELSIVKDDPKRILVRGARIYKGNDI